MFPRILGSRLFKLQSNSLPSIRSKMVHPSGLLILAGLAIAQLPPGTCPPGSGKYFFRCASNGFNGCCSVDACSLPAGQWCPDYYPWTYDPTTPQPPVEKPPISCPAGKYPTCGSANLPPGTCAAGSGQTYYDCQSNKFKGCCSQDACNMNTGPWYVQLFNHHHNRLWLSGVLLT